MTDVHAGGAPAFSPDLNRTRRDADLTSAVDKVSDLIVVGGGITGTGIALDAASRGLSVTLVEARDLAYGTSRWSSKLIHGGLRYLAHGDIAVAWESARERHHLMTSIAPNLIRPLAHVLINPTAQARSQDLLVRAGLLAADGLRRAAGTPRQVLPGSRYLTPTSISPLLPNINPQAIRGGVGYWDGQLIDDAQLVVSVARTAAAYGARILTRMRAIDIGPDEVVVHDALRGGEHRLRTRAVIIATGIWSGQWDPELPIRLSRGTHIVIEPERLGRPKVAMTVPVADAKSRYVFALPQPAGPIIAGLTDVPADDASPDDTAPPQAEIDWILEHLSTVLRTPLSRDDVIGAYAGYRPLVSAPDGNRDTADISRRHLVHRRADGVIIVTGGKLTTYRRMAADAIDALGITDRACRTASLPLVNAEPHRPHTHPTAGSQLDEDILQALVVDAIEREGALTVDDIVQRRTRISLQPALARNLRSTIARIARGHDSQIVDIEVDA